MRSIKNKKAALELSIGTVVIIVLAVTMLILGLVLVRSIFSQSKYNVDIISEGVRAEIQKLFQEDTRSVVYLQGGLAEIKQGDEWGIAFSIKNLEEGTTSASTFTYEVKPLSVGSSCPGLTEDRTRRWIVSRGTGSFTIGPGQTEEAIIRFNIPDDAPLCIVPYDIIIQKDGAAYDTLSFDISIK